MGRRTSVTRGSGLSTLRLSRAHQQDGWPSDPLRPLQALRLRGPNAVLRYHTTSTTRRQMTQPCQSGVEQNASGSCKPAMVF